MNYVSFGYPISACCEIQRYVGIRLIRICSDAANDHTDLRKENYGYGLRSGR